MPASVIKQGRRVRGHDAGRAGEGAGLAAGEEQVAPVSGQDTCFAAVAVPSLQRRETIEIVPFRYDAAGASGSRFAIADAEVAPKALSTSGHARRFRSRVEAAIWGPTARPALQIPRTQQPGQR